MVILNLQPDEASKHLSHARIVSQRRVSHENYGKAEGEMRGGRMIESDTPEVSMLNKSGTNHKRFHLPFAYD